MISKLFLSLPIISSLVFAADVEPTGKYGFVKLKMANEAKTLFGSKFYASFSKDGKGTKNISGADVATKVFEGKGCLLVTFATGGYVKSCGYDVKEGETLEIPLSLLSLEWDPAKVAVDIAPFPTLSFRSLRPEVEVHAMARGRFDGLQSGVLYLLPPGEYESYVGDVEALADQKHKVALAGEGLKTLEVVDKDARTQIVLKVEKPKYPNPESQSLTINEILLAVRNGNPVLPKDTLKWNAMNEINHYTSPIAITFPKMDTTATRILRAFPFPKQSKFRHELILNNFVYPLTMPAAGTETVVIAALNVNHIDAKTPGYFLVKQLDGGSVFQARWKSGRNYVIYDAPLNNPSDSSDYFSTQRTLFVFSGYKYIVPTFAFDELGEFRAQSEHEVDLR